MRKWLYDRPWIWVVLFLSVLVAGSVTTLVIAQMNRPEIVKEKRVSLAVADPLAGHTCPCLSRTGSIPPSRRPARS